jgi:hypothetical protein
MDGSIGALDMMIYSSLCYREYTKITGLGTASDVSSIFTGVKTSSASFTSITFQTSTGNVTGTYRVYGLRTHNDKRKDISKLRWLHFLNVSESLKKKQNSYSSEII